jgi:hypothetical protein
MDLNDDQIKLLQEFVNDSPGGVYDAMDLIPQDYRQYFSQPREHGKQFKRAVTRHRINGIHLGELDLNSKHWTYLVSD